MPPISVGVHFDKKQREIRVDMYVQDLVIIIAQKKVKDLKVRKRAYAKARGSCSERSREIDRKQKK